MKLALYWLSRDPFCFVHFPVMLGRVNRVFDDNQIFLKIKSFFMLVILLLKAKFEIVEIYRTV